MVEGVSLKISVLDRFSTMRFTCFFQAEVLLNEYNCLVCFSQVEDCYITKCGHLFCKVIELAAKFSPIFHAK